MIIIMSILFSHTCSKVDLQGLAPYKNENDLVGVDNGNPLGQSTLVQKGTRQNRQLNYFLL